MLDDTMIRAAVLPSLAVGVSYLWMGAFLYSADRRAPANRSFALVCALFAVWSCGAAGLMSFAGRPSEPVWERIAYFGAGTYTVAGLFFFLSLGGYLPALLSRPPLLLLVLLPISALQAANLGWNLLSPKQGHPAWYLAHHIAGAATTAAGLCFLALWERRTRLRRERLQARWIILITLIGLPAGIAVDFILDPRGLVSQANVVPFFWTVGVFYAVRRFGLLRLSPANAARTLMGGIDEYVFVLDPDIRSAETNAAADRLLGLPPAREGSRPAEVLFAESEELRAKLESLVRSDASSAALGLLVAARKGDRLLRATAYAVRDGWNDPIGFVVIARNWEGISELARNYRLSEREGQVLELILAGLSQKEMADRLFLSLPTIKSHTTGLYNKLGVSNRGEVWSLCAEKN